MITKAELRKAFPLTVKVTEEMLKGVDTFNVCDCIGTRALRKALQIADLLPKDAEPSIDITWGVYTGTVFTGPDEYVTIIATKTNYEGIPHRDKIVDMMQLKEPTWVVLSIKHNSLYE